MIAERQLEGEKYQPGAKLKATIAPFVFKIEQAMRKDLAGIAENIAELLDEVVRYGLFNGGKRIRPLLTILCYRFSGGDMTADSPEIYRLAIAFEYLHCATLFHDDVIDQATIRRGRPAVNVAYGQTVAILAGDFLHARSMLLVGREGGVQALEIFCEATAAMVDGEFLQLYNANKYNLNEDDYFAVIMGKTARLIGAACHIGALAAGADHAAQQVVQTYGLHLGCAFQIIDDLLDYLGDMSTTGKAVGNDFCEGKMTLPLIIAITRAEEQDKQRLLSFLMSSPEERKKRVVEATRLITHYDGFLLARQKAEAIIATALAELDSLASTKNQLELQILHALAAYVLSRNK